MKTNIKVGDTVAFAPDVLKRLAFATAREASRNMRATVLQLTGALATIDTHGTWVREVDGSAVRMIPIRNLRKVRAA